MDIGDINGVYGIMRPLVTTQDLVTEKDGT